MTALDAAAAVRWPERVVCDPQRARKADLWRGSTLFAGLDCLAPGQARTPHRHAGADKFYLVLRGAGTFEVGETSFSAGEGTLVPAPAGVPHGVRNTGTDPLVVLTVMSPPPEPGPGA
ncbi:MAG: cupin domain-containing protein [Gemmatimonadota bacterium]